jgi:hypothetical protein
MQGTCNGAVTADRYNTLEIGYNHYHNRKGIAMPQTLQAITNELRNYGAQQFNMFHESLTHGDIAYGGVSGIKFRHSMRKVGPSIQMRLNGAVVSPSKAE